MIEAEWWEYDSLDELADAVAGGARCAQGTPRDRRDARPAAGGSAGAARHADPRRDPVGADDPGDRHWRQEARIARRRDRRWPKLKAADRPSARRSRSADRHPLVSVN